MRHAGGIRGRGLRRHRAAAIAAALLVFAGALAAVLILTGGGPRGPRTAVPPQPPPPTEEFGANTGRLFNDRTYTPAEIDGQLAALGATGATVARSDAQWEASEPAAPSGGVHHYDWRFDDSIAGGLAAHGLGWLPIIDYSAPWAQSVPGVDHSPPASAADYAAYAGALAKRYGPGGSFWAENPQLTPQPVRAYEVWNEPDNPAFWSPAPNAGAYAALYLRARAAIDASQPRARVLVGGLTHPASFMAAMVAAAPELTGKLDGVAIHPYGPNPAAVLAGVRAARLALAALGIGGVPLYVTEFGWTTHPPGALDYLPERLRPGYIERTLAALGHQDCGVAAAFLYAWVTPSRNPTDPQDWYGIDPPGGGSSVDTAAFTAGLRAASAPAPAQALCNAG